MLWCVLCINHDVLKKLKDRIYPARESVMTMQTLVKMFLNKRDWSGQQPCVIFCRRKIIPKRLKDTKTDVLLHLTTEIVAKVSELSGLLKIKFNLRSTGKTFQQDAPLMALHGMLNVAPIIPHCMFRRYLKNILPWPLK